MDMHEWSLAQSVIYTAVEHQKRNNLKRIDEIRIRLGELQQIDRETFELALKEVAQQKGMNPGITIEPEEAAFRCRACSHTWKLGSAARKLAGNRAESIHFVPEVAHIYLRCPECQSPDFEILAGRGVWIESIRGLR
jgi:hydrogenase nickel incorporation protein HypA/HybF